MTGEKLIYGQEIQRSRKRCYLASKTQCFHVMQSSVATA